MRQSFPVRLAARASGLFALLIFAVGCDTGPGESLYDPDRSGAPDPQVTSVSPDASALAGVDVVTITGSNFGDAENTLVYFGETRAEVVEATAAELRVRAPNVPGDAEVRVVVLGAENFSNTVAYRLDPAIEFFEGIDPSFEEPTAIVTDTEGGLYASLLSDGVFVGVREFTSEGERVDYFDSPFGWSDLVFDENGSMYGVRVVQAIFQLPEGGTQQVWSVLPAGTSLTAMAFDDAGRVWAGGNNASLFRVVSGVITDFAFEADVRDLEVRDGYLYVAARQDGSSAVWRFPISDTGDLGQGEIYFDVAQMVGENVGVSALAFAEDGALFVGTNGPDPVYVVEPSGGASPLYPGVLPSPVRSLAWGAGTTLYALKGSTSGEVARVYAIATRRQGPN